MIFDGRTGRLQHTLDAPDVIDAQIFLAGDRLATLGDRLVVVWDAASGEALQRLVVGGRPRSFRVLGDRRLATWQCSRQPGSALIWDFAAGSLRDELRQPRGFVKLLEASPCGARLVTVGAEVYAGVVYANVWDAESGELLRELRTAGSGCRWARVCVCVCVLEESSCFSHLRPAEAPAGGSWGARSSILGPPWALQARRLVNHRSGSGAGQLWSKLTNLGRWWAEFGRSRAERGRCRTRFDGAYRASLAAVGAA